MAGGGVTSAERKVNLWTPHNDDLVINDLPGGCRIVIWENYVGRRKRWYEVRLVWPRDDTREQVEELICSKPTYAQAKKAAETYIEERFAVWVMSLEGLRPPQLGIDLLHPDDTDIRERKS